jgi:dTDP-4-dehydrorhamnose reductase
MWGGVECTLCRVQDGYIDQLELTGHSHRSGDIDRIASLGVRALRYPVLWERVAPDGIAGADWSWADERLARIRAHGITPVLGLLHHGSGPRDTALNDPLLPRKFAAYATACAARYPWIELVIPLNEPLTTARFAGLYGHWHPHERDDCSFVQLLLNQCFAIRAAMNAVRAIAPGARLVQTEDLGHVHASPTLTYQADFENERRWLTWDLLYGRVIPGHSMYDYLCQHGATPKQLDDLAGKPCPPDQLGVDHYVTSERFLDANVDAYSEIFRGGNGRHAYADIDVARARPELRRGPTALLREVWDRYHVPIILGEVNLACDDERERVRWLVELWDAALTARNEGCDIRAVTAWSLFGSSGWDVLSTRADGRYDPGAFDVASGGTGEPRETAVARAIRTLARHGRYEDDALTARGWWHCPLGADTPSRTPTVRHRTTHD